jgi:hypothetical protein
MQHDVNHIRRGDGIDYRELKGRVGREVDQSAELPTLIGWSTNAPLRYLSTGKVTSSRLLTDFQREVIRHEISISVQRRGTTNLM